MSAPGFLGCSLGGESPLGGFSSLRRWSSRVELLRDLDELRRDLEELLRDRRRDDRRSGDLDDDRRW